MAAKRFVATIEIILNEKDWHSANEYAEMMAGYIYRYDMNKIDAASVTEVTELD